MTTQPASDEARQTITIRPYDHNLPGLNWEERCGIVIEATGDNGYDRFPSIYLADDQSAELSDIGTVRDDAAALADWLEAAAEAIRERLDRF